VVRVIIAIVLWLLPASAFAQAEKRIALLIGNKDYKTGVGALTNPLNDIRIVGDALKSVGFEVLKPVENAQRSAMLIAIHAFAAKLKAAGPDALGSSTTQVTVSHQPAKIISARRVRHGAPPKIQPIPQFWNRSLSDTRTRFMPSGPVRGSKT
jgi:hypothetical protein